MDKTGDEIRLDQVAYRQWEESSRGDNKTAIEKDRRMLPIALQEYVAEKQRTYIIEYYVNGLTQIQIAEKYDVDKSTVSRQINRGLDHLYDHLRFVDPIFNDRTNLGKTLRINRKNKRQRTYKRTVFRKYKNRLGDRVLGKGGEQ